MFRKPAEEDEQTNRRQTDYLRLWYAIVEVNARFERRKDLHVETEGEGAELDAAVLQDVVTGVFHVEGNAHNPKAEHPVDGDGTLADVLFQLFNFVAKQCVLSLDAAVDIEVHHRAEANPEVIVEVMDIF